MSQALTVKQREWLEHLRDHGPAAYGRRGTCAYTCRRAGWTEWMARDRETGEIMSRAEALARFGEDGLYSQRWEFAGNLETITEAGRALLPSSKEQG
jgi:hypothetical protein